MFEAIPDELKQLPQWVGYLAVWDEKKGKYNKVPISPRTLRGARANDPATWGTFAEAVASVGKTGRCKSREELVEGRIAGIGFEFANGYFGVDIDHKEAEVAAYQSGDSDNIIGEFIHSLCSYSEYSLSGTGIHIIMKGNFPSNRGRRKSDVEMYAQGRFFAMTGNPAAEYAEIADCSDKIRPLFEKYIGAEKAPQSRTECPTVSVDLDDMEIINRASRSRKNGQRFALLYAGEWEGLYPSQSEADLAFCNMLAFWCGRDADRMDRIFRASGLYREEKWERLGQLTIEKAIAGCRDVYQPRTGNGAKANRQQDAKSSVPAAGGFRQETVVVGGNSAELRTPLLKNPRRYKPTDIGDSYLFGDMLADRFHYVPEAKSWYWYDGKVWKLDSGNLHTLEYSKKLVDLILQDCTTIPDPDQKQAAITHFNRLNKARNNQLILDYARSVHPVSLTDFDKDPYLFSCQNGVLDLRTMAFRKHSPADLLSKISRVVYNPAARCERWERFIAEVTQHPDGTPDPATAHFLKKALGYSISGDSSKECFFILYGSTTRNGKGTTMETMLHLMGDYGKTAQPETIASKSFANGSSASEDVARLAGARFVNMSEPAKGLDLNAALVKQLTGNDTVTARMLHQNSFEFKPEFKLFINTNYLPRINDDSIFASGRVKLIPFERHFDEKEQDTGLKDLFRQEESVSGIFNWLLEGLKILQDEGLGGTERVKAAVDSYREESDTIRKYFEEHLIASPGCNTKRSEVYKDYQVWCLQNGYKSLNSSNFCNELKRFVDITKYAGIFVVRNYSLQTEFVQNAFEPERKYSDY